MTGHGATSALPGRSGDSAIRRPRGELLRIAPFLVAMAVPFVALLIPPATHEPRPTIAAAVLTCCIVAGVVAVASWRLPAWVGSLLALSYLPVVALLRESEGGALSGYGPLVLVPLLWIALYGGRRALAACIVGIGLVLVLPIIVVGGGSYQEDAESRRALVWILAALLVGPTVQELVRRTRASEQRFRSIFENVREVIFQTDLDGRWTVLNPAWRELTGHDVDASLGRSLTEYVHPDDIAGNQVEFERLRADLVSGYRHEMRYRTATDDYRWFEVWARRLEDEDGQLLGITGTLTDVTDRYEAERMKEQFFALVSHELRTPLTAIIGYLELLDEEEGDRLSEDGRHFVTVMQRNSQRLLRLIGDLLFAAQVEAGKLSLVLGDVHLAPLVVEACDSARPRAEQRGLELRCGIDAPHLLLHGDRERLGQVLDNLLTNAIKFTAPGGSVEVRLLAATGEDAGEVAVIEVQDTGEGIAPEDQARLFERFQRSRTADANAVQGVGLGLAITHAIVDGHAGRISVRSTVGRGSTFRVELPLRGTDRPAGSAADRELTSGR